MWLNNTGHSFEIVLGEAHTMNALPYTVAYTEGASDGSTIAPAVGSGVSNGTTAVPNVVSAPASGKVRSVLHFSCYNADTVQHIFKFQKNEGGGTTRTVFQATLAVGDTVYYSAREGWYVLDSSGNRKQTVGSTGAPTNAQYLTLATDATLSAERVLTPGAGLAGSDGGAGGNYTLSVATASLTGWLYGFHLEWLSTTTLSVGIGACRDKADSTFLAHSSVETITITSNGAALGNDSAAISGTIATTSGSATITGTSTAFLAAFGTRAGTGTISTSGTAVTGSGTKFLSELAVNDLIGNATNGYSRVTAIASDTSATLAAAIPGGDLGAGSSYNVVENPGLSATNISNGLVNTIASDTSLTLTTTASGTGSSLTAYRGRCGNMPGRFAYVWIGKGSSGTTVYVSSQRTTPYGVTNYNDNVRRVGSILLDSSAQVVVFDQWGNGPDKTVVLDLPQTHGDPTTRLLSGGSATSWTAVVCSTVAPPTAIAIYATILCYQPSSGAIVSIRRRNQGSGTATRNLNVGSEPSPAFVESPLVVPCDGAQAFDYALNTAAGSAAYVDYVGYLEGL